MGEIVKKAFRQINRETIFRFQNRINYPPHLHDDIEVIFVKKGSGTIYLDGKKYTFGDNSIILVFPNQVHFYYDCDTNGEYYLGIFSVKRLLHYSSILSNMIPESPIVKINESENKNLFTLVNIFMDEFKNSSNDVIDSFSTLIMGKVLRHYALSKRKTTGDSVSNVIRFCEEHYRENISISTVAKQLKISKNYVSYIFSKNLKIGFCEYINALRISYAINLLETEDMSITEIADLSGFNTLRTFNRAFLNKMEISPTKYKKLINKRTAV